MEEKKEPITLEQLARLVVEGFEKTEQRFTAFEKTLEEGFQAVDEKIDREVSSLAAMVNTGFDHVEERFEQMEGHFELVESHLAGNDARLHHLDNRLDTFATHERRITRLEQEVGISADLV